MTSAKEVGKMQRAIEERLALVKRITNIAVTLMGKYGSGVSSNEGSCNMHVVRSLKNFGGLDFSLSTGETMMGGNTLEIYHSASGKDFPGLVFRVYWQSAALSDDDCSVKYFHANSFWIRKLYSVEKRQKKIAEKKEVQQRKVRKSGDNETAINLLREKAKRLGLELKAKA